MSSPIADTAKHSIAGQIAAIFFIQASSTSAFAVFYSGLSIFLTKNKIFSQESAAVITGVFLSLNYLLPLIGGAIANRIITYKRLYYLGALSSLIGCLLLTNGNYLYLGLSLFLMSSVSKVCLNMFVTQLFSSEQTTERRIAFTWNYVGMNLGFTIGFFLTGFSTLSNSYNYLFLLMSILMVASLILTKYFVKEPKLSTQLNKPALFQFMQCALVFTLLVGLIKYTFYYAGAIHNYITLFSIVMLGLFTYYVLLKARESEKENLLKFFGYSAISIVFWVFYMLTPIAIMQLIDHSVQRTIFGFTLAPQWLVNIDSLIILTFAPLLTVQMKRNDSRKKTLKSSLSYFSTAIFFVFCAFVILFLGLHFSFGQTKLPLLVMLGYLFFLTLGEIFISPASNAIVGELVPEQLRGVMTGVGNMIIGIGVLLASTIASELILPYLSNDGLSVMGSIKLQQLSLVSGCLLLFVLSILSVSRKKLIATETQLLRS